jgi:hypothetical protein
MHHVQRLVSVIKIETTEEQRSLVHFLWAKGLNAENIHKEIIPVYVEKCLLRKGLHNWVEKFSQGSSKVTDDVRPVALLRL